MVARKQIARGLRKHLTPAEHKVWQLVRNRQLFGLRFRRQYPVGPFVVDFYCAELRFIMEIDGPIHLDPAQTAKDHARTEWLIRRGYRVVRLANEKVSREALVGILRFGPPLHQVERGQG